MPKHNAPYDVCHVPLHRMNTPVTKMWFLGGTLRRQVASALGKRYRTGVGVLTKTLYLVAFVSPDGTIRELAPPHRQFEMWQIANQPGPGDCQCGIFYDPESEGAWMGNPKSERAHHPMCQFERTSTRVWGDALKSGVERKKAGLRPQARPDEWEKLRQTYQGK